MFELFKKEDKKIILELYSEQWNRCYLQEVIRRISALLYRNIAVNLLDKIIVKLLEAAMDLTNKNIAEEQQKNVTEKINELKRIKNMLLNYEDKSFKNP